MNRISPSMAITTLLLLAGIANSADTRVPIVREAKTIMVEGVEEHWRLEWESVPKPHCGPDDPSWWSCSCSGFAFGEHGKLVLVRNVPGQEEERFRLGSFFQRLSSFFHYGQDAILRRWDVQDNDFDNRDLPTLPSHVRARPIATIMRFGDYNHDGQSTEFFLQVDSEPCAKEVGVVMGVSRRIPRLHAFGTVKRPEEPVVLAFWHWEALRRAKVPIRVVAVPCGDHGSEKIRELELHADSDGIHVTSRSYECEMGGHRGKLVKEKVW